jgi:hypothetical protein
MLDTDIFSADFHGVGVNCLDMSDMWKISSAGKNLILYAHLKNNTPLFS